MTYFFHKHQDCNFPQKKIRWKWRIVVWPILCKLAAFMSSALWPWLQPIKPSWGHATSFHKFGLKIQCISRPKWTQTPLTLMMIWSRALHIAEQMRTVFCQLKLHQSLWRSWLFKNHYLWVLLFLLLFLLLLLSF